MCLNKKNVIIDTIDYKHILEKGNELFAIYYPAGNNINNLPVEAFDSSVITNYTAF